MKGTQKTGKTSGLTRTLMNETYTISRIDVIKGTSDVDLTGLSDLLLEHEGNRLDSDPSNTHYEDSHCPDHPIVDRIVDDMIDAFKVETGLDLELHSKWAHIHQKNMSTNIHDHYPSDVSSVFYVSVPEGSGNICFHPSHNKYHPRREVFESREGMFLMFPGTLEHSVTRNHSERPRISLSFNFSIINNDQYSHKQRRSGGNDC